MATTSVSIQTYELFIEGQFVSSTAGETFESVNPFNGKVIARFARGKKEDIDKAVRAARHAFDEGPWPRLSGGERADILYQLADLISENGQTLIEQEIADSGSTYRKAKGDVWLASKQLKYFADLARQSYEAELKELSRPGTSKNILVREPVGVCAQIIPWNFPLLMAIWKLGPALAAGNTIVLKPAEETSLSAMTLARLIQQTKIPAGVVNIVTGYGEEAGESLARHPGVDKVAFTGSTEIGRHVMQCAAPTLKRVTLECGGKSANIVFDDANLDMAVDAALYGAFFHAGQCCTAGTRLFLQESIYPQFLEALVQKTRRIQLGDPGDKATDLGPLVSRKQQERVLGYIETGKKEGARCLTGGGIPNDPALANGYFVEPTIFTDVDNHMRIAQEEIFGPVLCVLKFRTSEEAVHMANDSIYGLAAAVWSEDADKALSIACQLRAGTVWVNEYHLISEKAPFGGFKQSGVGRELGLEGFYAYTELKHIYIDEIRDRQKKFWYDSVLAPKL